MKATLTTAALLLCFLACSSSAQAQYPWCWPPIPQAPDAMGPGYYCLNQCGCVMGPNWCVYPPFPPFNGMVFPPKQGGAGGPGGMFPQQPFVRSPRDFWMVDVDRR
jgi:hypothetical protein